MQKADSSSLFDDFDAALRCTSLDVIKPLMKRLLGGGLLDRHKIAYRPLEAK